MPRQPNISPQTRLLLATLLDTGSGWHYGYALSKATGLKSGTLYPLLIRLHEQGYLDQEWREPERAGKPARHVYRLTGAGADLAREQQATSNQWVPA